jgi:hypothetical protein
MKKLSVKFYSNLLIGVLVVGCAALGLEKARNTEDRVQYAKSLASGAYKTIGDLKAQKLIKSVEGLGYWNKVEAWEKRIEEVEGLLCISNTKTTDPITGIIALRCNEDPTAASRIESVITELLAITTELNKRKK